MKAPAALILTVACTGLVLTGCSTTADQSAAPTESAPTDVGPTSIEEALAGAAEMYGIQDPPTVEPIRKITPAESMDVINECLVDHGWTLVDGSFTYPEEQDLAFRTDSYICTASYPIREEYLAPLDEAAWGRIYDHWVSTTVPCLQAEGLDVSDPPTRDTFIASPTWTPDGPELRRQVEDLVKHGRYTDTENVFTELCPVSPPADVRLGD